MSGPTPYRVVSPYTAAFVDALSAALGDWLDFERRPSEWTGWIWCRAADGRTGWVPEAWVVIEGARCRLLRDYSGREVSVSPGQELLVHLVESGWAWAESAAGETGWVPVSHLAPSPASA